jgi:hypothetical protein
MSELTVNRIRGVLEQQFDGKIDMSDYSNKPPEERRKAFLSRGLAALSIKNLARVDAQTASQAVTDGFHDGGLDAIHFDHRADTLVLVQSKWSDSGTKRWPGKFGQ